MAWAGDNEAENERRQPKVDFKGLRRKTNAVGQESCALVPSQVGITPIVPAVSQMRREAVWQTWW
jgi:hypothetical protein